MIIDGYFIKKLVDEFQVELNHARLEKIQQIGTASFLFHFYRRGEKRRLIIHLLANDYRAYFTNETYSNFESSQFLVALKKHLEGAIVSHVSQHLDDRVIVFHFEYLDYIFGKQNFQLIFEAMGKHANLLIVKDDKILETYKKMFFEDGRQLLPHAKFEFFPSDKQRFDYIDYNKIENPMDILNSYMGISKMLAQYLYHHQYQIDNLVFNPTYSQTVHKFYATDIFEETDDKIYYPTLSVMMENYKLQQPLNTQSYKQFIKKQLKKYRTKAIHLEQQYEKALKDLTIKDKADLIYMSGLNLSAKMHEIEVNTQKIKLDEHLTLNENAQKYYKKYQKAKRSIDPILKQIQDNQSLIELFVEFEMNLSFSHANDLEDLEKALIPFGFVSKKQKKLSKKQKHKPHILEIKDEDATYLIGKNAIQNQYITHDLSNPQDDWFHVKDAPGSHVLVKCSQLNEKIIRKAAMLAAYHSKLKLSSSIPVDYTKVKFIKKIPNKPGYQVIYKENKTIFIDIDQTLINTYLQSHIKL